MLVAAFARNVEVFLVYFCYPYQSETVLIPYFPANSSFLTGRINLVISSQDHNISLSIEVKTRNFGALVVNRADKNKRKARD
jgi:hypothetical protein